MSVFSAICTIFYTTHTVSSLWSYGRCFYFVKIIPLFKIFLPISRQIFNIRPCGSGIDSKVRTDIISLFSIITSLRPKLKILWQIHLGQEDQPENKEANNANAHNKVEVSPLSLFFASADCEVGAIVVSLLVYTRVDPESKTESFKNAQTLTTFLILRSDYNSGKVLIQVNFHNLVFQ